MTKPAIAVLGIDLGKNRCSLAGLDASGAVVLRRKMMREGVVAFTATLPSCLVAMEACCGAHFLGRALAAQGHVVRLMSPEYVQPYVKAQKTDDRDAEAIAEATTRPTMRFVTLKSEGQLDLQALHRARERLVQSAARGSSGAWNHNSERTCDADAPPQGDLSRGIASECPHPAITGRTLGGMRDAGPPH